MRCGAVVDYSGEVLGIWSVSHWGAIAGVVLEVSAQPVFPASTHMNDCYLALSLDGSCSIVAWPHR